ncbi:MAG: hypothetical protein WCP60_11695 [bacterium]
MCLLASALFSCVAVIDVKVVGDIEDGSCKADLAYTSSYYDPNCFDYIKVEQAI